MDEPTRLTLSFASPEQTEALAARLAAVLRAGDLLCLEGPVGAGKTLFARAFIRAATDPAHDVPSPTFTLVQEYHGSSGPIWHMDLYRLGDPGELVELGLEDALDEAICLVEWPARLGDLMPARRLELAIAVDPAEELHRHARLTAFGSGWDKAIEQVGRQDGA